MMDADIEGDKYGEGRGIQRRGLGPPNSWLRPKRAPNKEEKTEIFLFMFIYRSVSHTRKIIDDCHNS